MQSITPLRAPCQTAPRQTRASVLCRAAPNGSKQQAPKDLMAQALQQGAALCASMLLLSSGK